MLILVKNHSLPIRLDRYLRLLHPNLTQGVIEKNLRKGYIKVNNVKSSSNNRVKNGDEILLPDSLQHPQEEETNTIDNPAVIALSKKLLSENLIFTHQDFYAINKQAGIPVQGGNKVKFSIDDCFDYLKKSGHDLRLVHRLDQDTSGILLIARNREAAITLTSAFKNHLINKTYLAILAGTPLNNEGTIENELMGKFAHTNYQIMASCNNFSLIKFMPITGRTHQLRIHALDLGTYIVGDDKYGPQNQKTNLMLHAYKAELSADIFGESIEITHSPNLKFMQLIKKLFDIDNIDC